MTRRGWLHLPEGEPGLGLGPVSGDHLGNGPVVVAADQDVPAEDLLFQGGAGGGIDVPGKAQVPRLVADQFPCDDAPDPGLGGDRLDLGLDLVPGPADFPRARVAASSSSFLPALARVVPSNPRAWLSGSIRGVRQDRAAVGAVDGAAGAVGAQAAEPVVIDQGAG